MAIRVVFFASLLVAISYTPILVDSTSWWNLGVTQCASGGSNCETCAKLQDMKALSDNQTEKCAGDSRPVQAIAKGTRQAIIECQKRFQYSSWNCSTFEGDFLFGSFVSEKRTRETAALYGFLTAGATKAVADACHEERLPACPCVGRLPQDRDDDDNLIFTDCSDNLDWAWNYVSDFVSPSNTGEVGPISDQHNINVGAMAVNQHEKVCTCHGISGSCSTQTCYQKAPDVSEVGETLFTKYSGAVRVDLVEGVLRRFGNPSADPLDDEDLTYVDNSPNFCTAAQDKGILGTANRLCNPAPDTPNSCSNLCCGRGFYESTLITPVEQCEFVFCCKIVCKNIRNDTVVEARCNS